MPNRAFVHATLACRRDLVSRIGYDPNLDTVGQMGEDVKMVMVLPANYRGCYFDDALMINQQDREIFLLKGIHCNQVQLLRISELYHEGVLRFTRRAYTFAVLKKTIKLVILNIMRCAPPLYKLTLYCRSYGERAEGWTLSRERQVFLDTLRNKWGTSTNSQLH